MADNDINEIKTYFIDHNWKFNESKNSHFIRIKVKEKELTITIFPHKFKQGKWNYIIDEVFSNNYFDSLLEAKSIIFNNLYSIEKNRKMLRSWYYRFNKPNHIKEKPFNSDKAVSDIKKILSYVITLELGHTWQEVESKALTLPLAPRELIQRFIEKILFGYPIKHRDILLSQLTKPSGIPNIIRACNIK